MPAFLETRKVTKEFREGPSSLKVLKGIDLRIKQADLLLIVGPSGAGKSTFLHILGLLDSPTSGSLHYQGEDLNLLSRKKQAQYRNKLFGFVFQFFHLLPDFDACEKVMMPAIVGAGLRGWRAGKKEFRARAEALLGRVGLAERLSHRPSQLSGGEKQRVAIARAMMNQPEVLLLDEPTGNLDVHTSNAVHELIWELNEKEKQTIVIVTHDEQLATRSGRIVRMRDGRLV